MGSGCRSPARDERAVLPSLPGLCCVRGGLPSLERLGWCRGFSARARPALRRGPRARATTPAGRDLPAALPATSAAPGLSAGAFLRLAGPRPTFMRLSPTAARTINASATAPRAGGGVVGPRRRNEFGARAAQYGPQQRASGWFDWVGRPRRGLRTPKGVPTRGRRGGLRRES